MPADASSTPVAWGFVRISREPIDDLKEVLRQYLFGQCLDSSRSFRPISARSAASVIGFANLALMPKLQSLPVIGPEPRPGGGLLVPMTNLPRSSLRHSRP